MGESLEELSRPQRIAEILAQHEARTCADRARQGPRTLIQIFAPDAELDDDFDPAGACMICHK